MANQSKSMQEYFEQLKEIDEDFKRSEFFPSATDEQINNFEKEHNIQIPESYKQWLHLSNGGYLFCGGTHLYGVYNNPEPSIGNDFSNGMVPKEYLIIGYFGAEHICYNGESHKFFFYEYEDPSNVLDECDHFDDFRQVLEYIIDIGTN